MRVPLRGAILICLLATTAAEAAKPRTANKRYEKDVAFAVKQLGTSCARLLKSKHIDWKKVGKTFRAAAKKIDSEAEYTRLLMRLVARLQDGHAYVRAPKGKKLTYPEDLRVPRYAPGMHWCRIGKKIYVKLVFGAARAAGVTPGAQVLSVNGEVVGRWLAKRIARERDIQSFSTDQQAEMSAMHWGLAEPEGTRIKLKLKSPEGKTQTRTISVGTNHNYVDGPIAVPKDVKRTKDLAYGRTSKGYGYIHVRRCKGTVVEQLDVALAAIGEAPGLILDFRANSGGGFDHEAFFGRFIPKGKKIAFHKRYVSAGETTYGGPIVVIVDGTVASAGETCSGMLKEDGRAYLIGESPTAGMSSSKTTIPLPSGLAELYVSVASNMGRFNEGRGIEGIGVPPHRIVTYAPEDLAAGEDTMIKAAEAVFLDWPKKVVPYHPRKFGWTPPK